MSIEQKEFIVGISLQCIKEGKTPEQGIAIVIDMFFKTFQETIDKEVIINILNEC